MEFGMFHEFPYLPGRSETEAFDEAMAQVDAAGARYPAGHLERPGI